MKRRISLLALLFLVLLAATLWWLARPVVAPPPAPPVAMESPTPQSIKPASPPSSQPLTYKPPRKGKYQGESDPRWPWWRAMEKQDPSFEWKTPINFYGKVVDQNDQPVPGATIKFVWNDTSSKGSSYAETISDAYGLFSLTDKKGKGVSVSVSKNGYYAGNAANGSFEYAAFFEWNYHEGDENDPTIFRLVKKMSAEPLVVGSAFNTLSYEQGTYFYDLGQGKLSRQSPTGAGLKFIVTRSQTVQGQPFDWTWTVDGVEAAVQPTTDEFPQFAPMSAYVPTWKIEEKADAESFRQTGQVRLYVHTNSGRYAVVDLQLSHPNKRELGPTLNVKSYLNPSGSRNLEYDPSKTASAGN